MDAIVIEGLKVNTVIGCFNWERQIIQPLMLDLIVHVDLSQAAKSDDLEHTLNYAQICELAAQTIQKAQPKLIEHAAQLVLQVLFETFSLCYFSNINFQVVVLYCRTSRIDFRNRSAYSNISWDNECGLCITTLYRDCS